MSEALSPNTKAIQLLTAPLIAGREKRYGDLLTPSEYKKLAKHLVGLEAKTAELRQAVARGAPPEALKPLVEKIRTKAYTVTDEDLDALRGRYSEDQLFEIIVAAAFGASVDRLQAAQRALEEV